MRMTLKVTIFVLMLAWCLPVQGFAESGKDQFKALISEHHVVATTQLYTAHNLYADHGKVRAINFRVGNMIPAGTPVSVKFVEGFENPITGTGEMLRGIKITTLPDRKSYSLEFNERYHPGKTIYDYANLMFCRKTFEEMTAGKTPDVIAAIHRSAVIEGMTKDEVIISYGYPAEHVTPSLHGNTWTYWKNRFKKKKICFDEKERATSCGNIRNNDL